MRRLAVGSLLLFALGCGNPITSGSKQQTNGPSAPKVLNTPTKEEVGKVVARWLGGANWDEKRYKITSVSEPMEVPVNIEKSYATPNWLYSISFEMKFSDGKLLRGNNHIFLITMEPGEFRVRKWWHDATSAKADFGEDWWTKNHPPEPIEEK